MSRDAATLQEAAFIDALVSAPESLDDVAEIVKPHTFHDRSLARIYEGVLTLDGDARTVDRQNLFEWLEAHRKPSDPDWAMELREVCTGDVPTHDIVDRAQTVFELWRIRAVMQLCERTWKRGGQITARDGRKFLEDLQDALYELDTPGGLATLSEHTIAEVAQMVSADVRDRMELPPEQRLPGITTGYGALDRITGGWWPGATSVIKALPGVGKTALGLNLAVRCAERQERTVLIFSLEMATLVVGQRVLAAWSGVDLRQIQHAGLSYNETLQFHEGVARIRQIGPRCIVVDCPGLTPAKFRRIMRRYSRKGAGIALALVDYLQIMDADLDRPGATREQAVASMAKAMLGGARETGGHVLMLSQVNADGATKDSKKPQEDASLIARLLPAEGADAGGAQVIYDFEIEKNRNGPLVRRGEFQWLYRKNIQRFDTIDPRYAEMQQQDLEDWKP